MRELSANYSLIKMKKANLYFFEKSRREYSSKKS